MISTQQSDQDQSDVIIMSVVNSNACLTAINNVDTAHATLELSGDKVITGNNMQALNRGRNNNR